MCGIAGFLETRGSRSRDHLTSTIRVMTDALSHRGPDFADVWTDLSAGIALGHRRLAVLDLSPLGNQPMRSQDGRYLIVYNGEIYNFRNIREELEAEGARFHGGSDTEVLLEGIACWGLERALSKLNGMFAFAIWDSRERSLTLARDRFGEKPLYYGWSGSTFLFASELKAMKRHPDFAGQIDPIAVNAYFRLNYIPAPLTVYRNFWKLLPGATLNVTAGMTGDTAKPRRYWSLDRIFSSSRTESASPEKLEFLLRDSVKLRLEADVPLGAFLSGGVDSSTVVALMQQQTSRPVKTFTIGFDDAPSEAVYARAVARHLGTDHTELSLGASEALDVAARLPVMFDEPFADSSAIPTHLVSALARRHVTVALSGDGGDELFCGYTRYIWANKLSKNLGWLPGAARRVAGRAISAVPPRMASRLIDKLAAVRGGPKPDNSPGALRRLGALMRSKDAQETYLSLVSSWENNSSLEWMDTAGAGSKDLVRQLMYLDAKFYLPDDILVKLDRASMSVALESRVPLLDPQIIEYLAALPESYNLSGATKPSLRKILYKYVPKELIERPKMGFVTPVRRWLRQGWKQWAEAYLNQRHLASAEYIDPQLIKRAWTEHLSGRANHENQLWAVLMFEAWQQAEKSGAPLLDQAACLN